MPVTMSHVRNLSVRERLKQAEAAYSGLFAKAKEYIRTSQAEIRMLREENERLRQELEASGGILEAPDHAES